jgi:hypothetical protein
MDNNNYLIFNESIYTVFTNPPFILKLNEVPRELLHSFPSVKTWAFITAQNPNAIKMENEMNALRNLQLLNDVKEGSYSYIPGIGSSPDGSWSEESFLILNIDFFEANALSSKYGQLAFIFGDLVNGSNIIETKINF